MSKAKDIIKFIIALCRGVSQTEIDTTKKHKAIRLLELWRYGDEQEQRDTWECIKNSLDK